MIYPDANPTNRDWAHHQGCAVDGCDRRPTGVHKYCPAHGDRIFRFGDPLADWPIHSTVRPIRLDRPTHGAEKPGQPDCGGTYQPDHDAGVWRCDRCGMWCDTPAVPA